MKLKKKQKQWIGIILGIILVGIILNQTGLLSILGGSVKIDCISLTDNKISCTQVGGSNVDTKIDSISIRNPSNSEILGNLIMEKVESATGKSFKDYVLSRPDGIYYTRYSEFGGSDGLPSSIRLSLINEYSLSAGKQILIIEGDTNEGQPIKIYGFGYIIDRNFKMNDPNQNNDNIKINPSSFTIYVKKGGYTEADLCSDFQINCPIVPSTFYRFENNKCSEIKLLETEKTSIDYNSLSECELNIQNGDDNGDGTEKPNYFLFSLMIIGSIILIVGLFWLLIKTRRK